MNMNTYWNLLIRKKTSALQLGVGLVALLPFWVNAGESAFGIPLYESPERVEKAPKIDGHFDDAAWQGVERAPIQRQHHDEAPLPEGERYVGYWMATWDADHLYLAVEVLDEEVNTYEAFAYEPHNDVVEVFFDPLLNFQYNLQYRVWPFGKDGQGAEVSQDPTWGRWEVASQLTDEGYRTEMRIPLSHFMEVAQVDIQGGDLIGFDISIHDADYPTGAEWQSPKITGWSGDGTNWQYASENGLLAFGKVSHERLAAVRPEMNDIGETPVDEAMSLWPRIGLLEGLFNLEVLHQSWSWERYEPWRLGRIGHPLLDDRDPRDTSTVNRSVGSHAHGEALEVRPRVVELSMAGVREGRQEELTVVTTPFHPAISYRTSSVGMSLFNGMEALGQPSGPAYIALPLEGGMVIRELSAVPSVYDPSRDGPLAEGWVLVWFGRDQDGRATDFPIVIYPNRNPQRIEVNGEGGLHWAFSGAARNALTLLPLKGIAAVEKGITAQWVSDEALPESVTARIRRWQARSMRLPVGVREFWQYLPDSHAFELTHQFSYTENLSEWGLKEELIAPLPQLLSSAAAVDRFPEANLEYLDYRLFQGGLFGVRGSTTVKVRLPVPDLSELPPALDRGVLEQSELGRKYLKELEDLGIADMFHRNMDRVYARPHFMPHIWPVIDKPDIFSALTLLDEESLGSVLERMIEGYRNVIFSEDWRDRLWPEVSPYLGSNFRYGNLTFPYGVAEPYYGVVEMLSKMNYICQALDDYSIMLNHWDRIKELVEIIWHGGFTQYRYDGGTMIGEALVGLVQGARAAGDRQMEVRAMLRLAQHAASAPGYFEGGRRLEVDRTWTRRGLSPVLLGPVQQTTPTTAAAVDDLTLTGSDGTFYWDRGYGNPVVLRNHALEEVKSIETRVDMEAPHWFLETDHNFKRRDGMFRRYTARALVVRYPLALLEEELAGLRETFRENTEFDAAALIIFLQRLQEDLRSEGL